jgi:signal transduction histidine kinase
MFQAMRSKQFRRRAMLGYGAIVLVLAGTMVFAIRQAENITRTTTAQIRIEENKSTLADKLRWNEELMGSLARGFLITGDPTLRERLTSAEHDFDAALKELATTSVHPEGATKTADVARLAARFRATQADIDAVRAQPDVSLKLAREYESRIAPARQALRASLDSLVSYEDTLVQNAYRDAARERSRWMTSMEVLVAAIVLGGLIVAWLLSTALADAFRREQAAHDTARTALDSNEELIEILAHDLRNPLGAIIMQASMLRAQEADATGRTRAASIENIAMRMEYLIRTTVDASMLEMHRFIVLPGSSAVGEAIDAVMGMFQQVAATKHVRLDAHVEAPELVVSANREQVIEILSNLIGNALKFTPSEGTVTIAVTHSVAGAKFSISDNGRGIADEDLPRVFDRSWHKDHGGTKGTGLGLFIAKKIVEGYSGRIWVESTVGKGSTFHFTIPVAEEPSTVRLAAAPQPAV